jgi:hypothetical protein
MVGLIVGGPVQQVRCLSCGVFFKTASCLQPLAPGQGPEHRRDKGECPQTPDRISKDTVCCVWGSVVCQEADATATLFFVPKSSRGGWSGLSFRGKGFPDAY